MTDASRRMTAPLADSEPGSESVAKSGKPALSSLNVLIIDDDDLVSSRLELLLEAEGHGSVSVASLEQARQAMAAIYFPVLIIDRMLGDGDGMDICREFRARHPERRVYIMMLSTLDSPADVTAGLDAGADAYVSKRATNSELLKHLRAATEVIYFPPNL
jgi:two-component system, OmpR family, phosphate regulon response regulator OmpR